MKVKKVILILILFIINFTVSIFCLIQFGIGHDVLATTDKMTDSILKNARRWHL